MSLLPEPRREAPAQVVRAPSRVSVYVFTPPTLEFLTTWQIVAVLLGCLGVVCSIGQHLLPIGFFVYSITLALVFLPTGHRPVEYIRYLCKRIDDRPAVKDPVPMPDGSTEFLFFGQEKIAIGIDTSAVCFASISHFLRLFDEPFEFVTTTGCPKGDVVDGQTAIMVDKIVGGEKLVNCANQAGFLVKPIDAALFENSSSNNRASSQYIIEKLPLTVWMNELAHLLRQAKCHYTTIVRIAPADMKASKLKAQAFVRNQSLSKLHMLTARDAESWATERAMRPIQQGAQDLLADRTRPYELSVDISLCANEGMQLHLCGVALKHNAMKVGISLKHVRTRKLPFSSAFREPPAPYSQTVSQGAVVAMCPFFLITEKH
jgi:hypothetical protein